MNILWFSWKDEGHPQAGGAETVSADLRRQLVENGHAVTLITAQYPGSASQDEKNGVKIFRGGGRFGVYWQARKLYKKHLRDWPDLVVDEMNTIPFASAFYAKSRSVLLTYQLARKVWFYQMVFPISLVGYLIEPLYLFLISKKYSSIVTESESTRADLQRFGFDGSKIHVFRVGSYLKPVDALPATKKMNQVLSLGAVRPMKRTLHAVKGFEYARDQNPELTLVMAGDMSDPYAKKVSEYIKASRHADAITVLGRISSEEKLQLMRDSAVIVVTSIKEGWGLIITEAASQGTPAVAYDADGLRDSVQDQKTGLLARAGDPKAVGAAINQLLADKQLYETMRKTAWEWNKQFTFENSYKDFTQGAGIDTDRH